MTRCRRFQHDVALETVREDLGDVVIEGLDEDAVPVAAASRSAGVSAKFEGRDVAVKVQRPNMGMRRRARLIFVGQLGAVRRKCQVSTRTAQQRPARHPTHRRVL